MRYFFYRKYVYHYSIDFQLLYLYIYTYIHTNTNIILLTSSVSVFSSSDFKVFPVGNPQGIFTFTNCISFDSKSSAYDNFFLIGTNFIDP